MKLPRGVRIVHYPGRDQPYTVHIPGSLWYAPGQDCRVWQFCKSMDEALRYVAKATNQEGA